MSLLWLILGFILLVVGGEYLVRSSVGISLKLDLSTLVVGLTVVSFATSAPELLVSLQAALEAASDPSKAGLADIAIGNVIGSNIANIGLALGITAMVSPIVIGRDFFKFNFPFLIFFSLAMYFVMQDLVISRLDGILLLFALIIFLVLLILRAKRKGSELVDDDIDEIDNNLAKISWVKITIWLLIGALALYFGSEFLVKGAVDIATQLGVSEKVIAVSVIAIGTSVPEIAASVIAAAKQEKGISLGNLIGSNIFNIGSVLGITSLITPITVNEPSLLTNDIFWMIGISAILLPLALIPKKMEITRAKGFLYIVAYSVFMIITFTSN